MIHDEKGSQQASSSGRGFSAFCVGLLVGQLDAGLPGPPNPLPSLLLGIFLLCLVIKETV